MKHTWRIKWDLENTTLYIKSQTQLVHYIKQWMINHKQMQSKNPRPHTSTISTGDWQGSRWLSSREYAATSIAS